jgi:hypothetical protein
MSTQAAWSERFATYFDRPVAQQAAKSISNGAEMKIVIQESSGTVVEAFTFTRADGKNQVLPSEPKSPQLTFTLTPQAAEEILAEPSDEIATIGINIMKLVASTDANRRVRMSFQAGFLTLFTKGYLGVLAAGGGAFASYLASRGLGGIGAIKAALKKMQEK